MRGLLVCFFGVVGAACATEGDAANVGAGATASPSAVVSTASPAAGAAPGGSSATPVQSVPAPNAPSATPSSSTTRGLPEPGLDAVGGGAEPESSPDVAAPEESSHDGGGGAAAAAAGAWTAGGSGGESAALGAAGASVADAAGGAFGDAAGGAFVGDAAGGASVADAAGGSGGEAPLPGPLTVYIAGDSTVSTYEDTPSTSDQAGWGQMLGEHYTDAVTIDNHAIGGRTARRFIEEGRLDEIASLLQAGDYLLVQFGTNDGNKTATYELGGQTIPYYLDPDTDFKDYLRQYLDVANDNGATLVYVTPPPRNSAYCTGGNGTGAHAQAMRDLGQEEGVPVSDLNAKTVAHLTAICPAPTPEDFFLVRSDGTIDGTHFQENGARIMAGFVAEGIVEAGLPLARLGL